MSFAARLIHRVTILRTPLDYDETDLDDMGYPLPGTAVETEDVPALVQPKRAEEIAQFRSEGTEVSDHTIFMAPRDLRPADAIMWNGERYSIVGIREFAFGRSPHLEVDTRRVVAATIGVSGS
jgi:hypothetical protein